MHTHEPRPVDRAAPWRWAREAVALIARRPLMYTLSSVASLIFFFAALQVEGLVLRFALVLLLPPMALVGYVRLARAADHSVDLSPSALLPSNREALRVLGLAAAGYGLAFAALFFIAGAGAEHVPLADPHSIQGRWQSYLAANGQLLGVPVALLLQLALFGMSITAFCGVLLGLFSWFTLPLVQLSGLALVPATLLSLRAYRLNTGPLGIMGGLLFLVTIAVLLFSFGLAALLAAPFVGAMLYVSYRDVFLGQSQNAPVVAETETVVAAARA